MIILESWYHEDNKKGMSFEKSSLNLGAEEKPQFLMVMSVLSFNFYSLPKTRVEGYNQGTMLV